MQRFTIYKNQSHKVLSVAVLKLSLISDDLPEVVSGPLISFRSSEFHFLKLKVEIWMRTS